MCNLTYESSYQTPFTSSQLLSLILLSMAGQKHTPDTTTNIKDEYDYIVVGAGSAGSVVASRLSEKDCVTVLLLEAGKSPPKLTDVPVVYNSFRNTELDWQFKTIPQKWTGKGLIDKSVMLSAGKAIGGTSVINGMQAIRGNRKDFDNWAAQGATGWSYEEVLPYFKKLEDNVDQEFVQNGFHGVGGPVTISRPPYDSIFEDAVHETARQMGYDIVDANGPRQLGFNDQQATMRNGQRCSSAKAYLVPNEDKENLDIVANAFVRKIIINNGQAEGVQFEFEGRTREVRARKEVIISAGAIKSPQILMLSGIGPREELVKHNIPVVADLPVGRNLQEQYGVLLDFELDPNLILSFTNKLKDPISIWDYIIRKTGPLTSLSGTTNMAFLSKNEDENTEDFPDYQMYFGEGMHEIVKHKLMIRDEYHKVIYEPYQNKPFYFCLSLVLHPKARGFVTLNSSDPHHPPIIDPTYFSNPEDLDTIIAGMKKCKEFGTSETMKKIGSKPFTTIYPGCEDKFNIDEDYFMCIANSIVISSNHLAGTVKMGSMEDSSSVLDPQLRVKSIRNLRVVDASIMPTITSGNTHLPTMMIAEKASDMIKENIHCEPKKLSNNDMLTIYEQ